MDLPPSGWYPDPYGTPSLLRWWDGSGWTQHTHPDVTAGGARAGEPAATAVQAAAVQSAALQSTAVQSTTGQSTAVHGTAVHGTAVQSTAVQSTVQGPGLQATTVQPAGGPSAERLSQTKPPTGRPTAPQPALPEYPGAAVGVAPTAYQPPVTTVQPGGMGLTGGTQPMAMHPTTGHPTTGHPTTGHPTTGNPTTGNPTGGHPTTGQAGGGDGTQVLFLGGDAWQVPGGPAQANPYGYMEAQRRRRRWVIGGVGAGVAVAIAAIAVIATSMGGSPSTPVADQTTAAPPSPTAPASPTASASPTTSPSPATTATGSLLTDGQAGLSYTQLASPWQGASCPSTLDNGSFPWTAGESAVAGQINGGSTTWYGEACSGVLPQQYGYSGVAALQSTAENLAQTFGNEYYNDLDHNINTEDDQPLQVSGHAGWEISYDVSYTNAESQGATWTDERGAVVLVDNGSSQPAVFFTSIPATLNEENISTLIASLQLTSSSATASQSATATPTDTTQGGGNGNGGGGDGGGGGGNNP